MFTETDLINCINRFVKLFKSLAPGRDIRLKIFVLYFVCVGSAFSMEGIENEWGGHIKLNGSAVFYEGETFYAQGDDEEGFDGFANLRLKDRLILTDQLFFEVHYDLSVEWGDTFEKTALLKKQFSVFSDKFGDFSLSDDTGPFDLTKTLEETDHYYSRHRFDRLLVSYKPFWGNIVAGRQAVTWGNGLVFNPMDLFSPFSPSDTSREYKNGNDLVSIRINAEKFGDPEFLYVPGKEDHSDNIKADHSSFAGKMHFYAVETEFDLLFARHFDENIVGFGVSGTFFDTAWRTDLVYSTLNNNDDKNGFFTYIANIDYSWVWKGKNLYGLVEYYHNGLGKNDSIDALFEPEISMRIVRGEIFTLCRDYISSQIQLEIHPLFNISFNIIANLNDSSGLIQPHAVWSVTQNSSLDFGINKAYGKKGTEFGGIGVAGSPFYFKSPENIYLTFSYYF